VYGALVAAPDSIRTGLLKAFAPRTSAPSTATVLRSILWPVAILLVIQRSYVLATNGYITDDYGPVYRAVVNLKRGWDIYNEHFDQVDPHYLYPPGGTLLMAPFGYLPVDASRYWFVTINTIAIVIAACLLVKLFNYTLGSVALPALLVAMFCTESVVNTLVFGNINGCILLLEVLFFPLAARRQGQPPVVGGRGHRAVACGQTAPGAAALAAAAEPSVAAPDHCCRRAGGVQLGRNIQPGGAVQVSDPMNWVTRTLPYIFSIRDYFNSSIQGNGVYYGLPMWLILLLRIAFLAWRSAACGSCIAITAPAIRCSGWRHRRVCC